MHEVVHACIHMYVKARKQLLGILCGHHLQFISIVAVVGDSFSLA